MKGRKEVSKNSMDHQASNIAAAKTYRARLILAVATTGRGEHSPTHSATSEVGRPLRVCMVTGLDTAESENFADRDHNGSPLCPFRADEASDQHREAKADKRQEGVLAQDRSLQ